MQCNSELRLRFYTTATYSFTGLLVYLFQLLTLSRFPSVTHVDLLWIQPDGCYTVLKVGLNYWSVTNETTPPNCWFEEWSLGVVNTSHYHALLTNLRLRGDMTLLTFPWVNCVQTVKRVCPHKLKTAAYTPSGLYEYVLQRYGTN